MARMLCYVMAHLATETQDSRMPVANACPHCQTLVPVKKEHLYLQTQQDHLSELQEAFPAGRPLACSRSRIADGEAIVGEIRTGPQFRQ